jgi:hypothetical protein
LFVGFAQLVLSIIVIGWVWSIFWGWFIFKRGSELELNPNASQPVDDGSHPQLIRLIDD